MMNEVTIHCSYDELRAIGDLTPHPMNPNKHPQRQIDLLAEIIRTQGWRAPITISELSGFVVRGHGRLAAAMELGLEKVPVDLQSYESEAQEYSDLVADNKIAELAEIDEDQLAKTLKAISDLGCDFELAGFEQIDAQALVTRIVGEDMKPLKISGGEEEILHFIELGDGQIKEKEEFVSTTVYLPSSKAKNLKRKIRELIFPFGGEVR
jgi:ParB-like chromosome segregation protein Spo0J